VGDVPKHEAPSRRCGSHVDRIDREAMTPCVVLGANAAYRVSPGALLERLDVVEQRPRMSERMGDLQPRAVKQRVVRGCGGTEIGIRHRFTKRRLKRMLRTETRNQLWQRYPPAAAKECGVRATEANRLGREAAVRKKCAGKTWGPLGGSGRGARHRRKCLTVAIAATYMTERSADFATPVRGSHPDAQECAPAQAM
jgi:hypothetical protein